MQIDLQNKGRQLFQQYRHVILYFIIGSSAALIDLVVYLILFDWVHLPAITSTVISISSATAYGFTLNVIFNFKISDKLFFRFLAYATVSGVGMIISAAMLYFFHKRMGFDGNIIKIVSLPIIFAVQYGLNRLVSFRKFEEKILAPGEAEWTD